MSEVYVVVMFWSCAGIPSLGFVVEGSNCERVCEVLEIVSRWVPPDWGSALARVRKVE